MVIGFMAVESSYLSFLLILIAICATGQPHNGFAQSAKPRIVIPAINMSAIWLWGSRIVSKPNGTSGSMFMDYKPDSEMVLVTENDYETISIVNQTCFGQSKIWGQPCALINNNKTAVITMNNVTGLSYFKVETKSAFVSGANFVPNCSFPKPEEDFMYLKPSFPLSRFMGGQSYVSIFFAVGGNETSTRSYLTKDGVLLNSWKGIYSDNPSHYPNMKKNNTGGFIYLNCVFPRNGESRTTYVMSAGGLTYTAVSVDWIQNGESPEVEECLKYNPSFKVDVDMSSAINCSVKSWQEALRENNAVIPPAHQSNTAKSSTATTPAHQSKAGDASTAKSPISLGTTLPATTSTATISKTTTSDGHRIMQSLATVALLGAFVRLWNLA